MKRVDFFLRELEARHALDLERPHPALSHRLNALGLSGLMARLLRLWGLLRRRQVLADQQRRASRLKRTAAAAIQKHELIARRHEGR